jgi:2-polyprenyl-6-methoxyphenol hydroxylase-like FAD-dependent oxidoreductase
MDTLAGKVLVEFVPSLNAGVDAFSPCRRLFVTQPGLEPILRKRAKSAGARVLNGHEVVAFTQDASGVRTTVTNVDTGAEQTIRSKYLVGADGAHRMRDLLARVRRPRCLSNAARSTSSAACAAAHRQELQRHLRQNAHGWSFRPTRISSRIPSRRHGRRHVEARRRRVRERRRKNAHCARRHWAGVDVPVTITGVAPRATSTSRGDSGVPHFLPATLRT